MTGRFQALLLVFDRPQRSLTLALDGPAGEPAPLAARAAAIAQAEEQGLTSHTVAELRGLGPLSDLVRIELLFQWEDEPGSVLIHCSAPLLRDEKRILDAALSAVPGWARYGYRRILQISPSPQTVSPLTDAPTRSQEQARPTIVTLKEDVYALREAVSALAHLINAASTPIIVDATPGLALLSQIDVQVVRRVEQHPGLVFGVAGYSAALLMAGLTLDRTRLVVVPDALHAGYRQDCFRAAGLQDATSTDWRDPNRYACMVKACQVAHWTGEEDRTPFVNEKVWPSGERVGEEWWQGWRAPDAD